MKDFKFYLETGEVKRVSVNSAIAQSLRKDIVERAGKILLLDKNTFAKLIFEQIYDCLREAADTILALDGYKSYSHEASISYLTKFKFSYGFIQEFDSFRFRRNGSKYYGKEIEINDSEQIISFYKKYIEQLLKIIDGKLKNA